ncbi:MAG: hypothetical protein ACRD3L_14935 [Terriglobales bacterium]
MFSPGLSKAPNGVLLPDKTLHLLSAWQGYFFTLESRRASIPQATGLKSELSTDDEILWSPRRGHV